MNECIRRGIISWGSTVLLVSFPASQTSRFDRGWGDFMGSGTDQRHESIPVFPKCLSCSSVPFLLLAFVWPGTRKGHVRSSLASLNKYIQADQPCLAFDHAFLPFAFDDDVTSRVYLQEIFKSLQNNLIVALPLLQRNESGILKYLELIFKDKINSYRQQAKYNTWFNSLSS